MADQNQNQSGGSIVDLIANLQNGVINLGLIVQAIRTVFPQQTGTATTATAGGGTLPAAPDGFIVVNVPGVGVRKVPYYSE